MFAYATLLTGNEYIPGVLVLNHGLRTVKSKYPLVVMAPPKLSQEARDILRKQDIIIREVEYLKPENVKSENDKRFEDTWTKLRIWELIEYERIVLLDSDMIIRINMDELLDNFELPLGYIAAAHVCACNPRKIPHYPKDWVPENCPYSVVPTPISPPPVVTSDSPRPYRQLNSGLVALKPSKETFEALCDRLYNDPSVQTFVFNDQELMAAVFEGKWKILPWYYNALRTLRNIHPALWSDDQVRCLHYILADKPWQSRLMIEDGLFGKVNQWWWDVYDEVLKYLQNKDPAAAAFVSKYVDYDQQWKP